MRVSKALVSALPLLLAGCHDFFGEDSDTFYAPPAPAAVGSVPAAPPITPMPKAPDDCGCPQEPAAPPSSALPQPVAGHCTPVMPPERELEWHPSEGHLVYAGDLVMELKKSKGGTHPGHAEMVQYLQANMKRFQNMDVTAAQAEKILEELGL